MTLKVAERELEEKEEAKEKNSSSHFSRKKMALTSHSDFLARVTCINSYDELNKLDSSAADMAH